jgi:hypothetical protein
LVFDARSAAQAAAVAAVEDASKNKSDNLMKKVLSVSFAFFLGSYLLAQQNGNFIGSSVPFQNSATTVSPVPGAKPSLNFVPKDLWREIGGMTNFSGIWSVPAYERTVGGSLVSTRTQLDSGWVELEGRVLQSESNGIHLLMYGGHAEEYFIANFPYKYADGEELPSKVYTAKKSGIYTFITLTGSKRTIRQLDYGKPCAEPEWAKEQDEANSKLIHEQELKANTAADARKHKLNVRTFDWLLTQAKSGSPSAQCGLAEHYLNGIGCETNREKAIYWFEKAREQGDLEASNKLISLKVNK